MYVASYHPEINQSFYITFILDLRMMCSNYNITSTLLISVSNNISICEHGTQITFRPRGTTART